MGYYLWSQKYNLPNLKTCSSCMLDFMRLVIIWMVFIMALQLNWITQTIYPEILPSLLLDKLMVI